MSLESIRARVTEDLYETESAIFDDLRALLKMAEAAKKLDGFEPEDIDCEVWEADYQEAVKVLRAALAELEAGE